MTQDDADSHRDPATAGETVDGAEGNEAQLVDAKSTSELLDVAEPLALSGNGEDLSASSAAGSKDEPLDASPAHAAGSPAVSTESSAVALTRDELIQSSGCSSATINDLERHGLIDSRSIGPTVLYDHDALRVARLAVRFEQHGLEPRHLRTFRLAAEREMGLYIQVIGPQLHRKGPQARQDSLDSLHELTEMVGQMRSVLLGQLIREQFRA